MTGVLLWDTFAVRRDNAVVDDGNSLAAAPEQEIMAKVRKRRRPPVTRPDDRGALAAAWDPERDAMRNALEYLRSDCAAVGKVEAEGAGRVQVGRRRALDRSRCGSGARLRDEDDGEHDADDAGDHGGADGVEGALRVEQILRAQSVAQLLMRRSSESAAECLHSRQQRNCSRWP